MWRETDKGPGVSETALKLGTTGPEYLNSKFYFLFSSVVGNKIN